jgi:hypothetical protein
VLYVSAAGLERPPAALGLGLTVLVVPSDAATGTARASFEVSGCVGFVSGRRRRIREAA